MIRKKPLKTDRGFYIIYDLIGLGHWFGMVTLARDKSICIMFRDLKMSFIKVYHDGEQELLCTKPFVTKILESYNNSKICRIHFVFINLISDNLLG